MIQIEKTSVHDQLNQATAYITNRKQIEVSLVEPIEHISALQFFKKTKNLGDRMFWQNPTGDMKIAGVGAHKRLTPEKGEDRFQSIRKQWEAYLENCLLPEAGEAGTGPILFGGFSFMDHINQTDDTWKAFASGEMFLAKWMLTEQDGQTYLTHHTTIDATTNVNEIANRFTEMKKVLSKPSIEVTLPTVQSMHDQFTYEHWENLLNEAIDAIREQALEKVVLARKTDVLFDHEIPLAEVIERMIDKQTNSYVFVIEQEDDAFIGATPERLVQVKGNELLSACLAGTTARGKTEEDDEMLAWQLLNDEKNREEHDYVVQMIKQSVAPYVESFDIPDAPVIYPLKSLQHLFTPVTATLKSDATILDLVKQLHPTPALGGEPRDKALQFIDEKEPFDRGWYAGPIGWLDANFDGEFAVAIRSGLITENQATLFAGCGVVKDSDPRAEYEETRIKFTPMLDALGGTQ